MEETSGQFVIKTKKTKRKGSGDTEDLEGESVEALNDMSQKKLYSYKPKK